MRCAKCGAAVVSVLMMPGRSGLLSTCCRANLVYTDPSLSDVSFAPFEPAPLESAGSPCTCPARPPRAGMKSLWDGCPRMRGKADCWPGGTA